MDFYTLYSITKSNAQGGNTVIALQKYQSGDTKTDTLNILDGTSREISWEFSDDIGNGLLNMSMDIELLNTADQDYVALINSSAQKDIRLKVSYSTASDPEKTLFVGMLDKKRLRRPLQRKSPSSGYTQPRPYSIKLRFVYNLSYMGETVISSIRRLMINSNNSTHDVEKVAIPEIFRFAQALNHSEDEQMVASYFKIDINSPDIEWRKWLHKVLIDISVYEKEEPVAKVLLDILYRHGLRCGYSHTHDALLYIDYLALTNGDNPFLDDSEQIVYDLEPYFIDFGTGYPGETATTISLPVITYNDIVRPDESDDIETEEMKPGVIIENDGDGISQLASRYNQSPDLSVFRLYKEKITAYTNQFWVLDSSNTAQNIDPVGRPIWVTGLVGGPSPQFWAAASNANILFKDRDRLKITLRKIIDPMLPVRILATEYSLDAIFRPIKGSWDIIRLHTEAELLEVGQLEQSMNFVDRIGVAYNQWVWSDL